MEKVIDEKVAQLVVVMKNGDQVDLFHSWDDIIITEKGIELIPNAPNWDFSWETIDKIIVLNTRSEHLHHSEYYTEGDYNVREKDRFRV